MSKYSRSKDLASGLLEPTRGREIGPFNFISIAFRSVSSGWEISPHFRDGSSLPAMDIHINAQTWQEQANLAVMLTLMRVWI
jgi:hypothetical protein